MNNPSTRSKILNLTPGQSRVFELREIKVSYIRSLVCALKRDLIGEYSVHLCENDTVEVLRIK